MLSEELQCIRAALGGLLKKVDPETAETLCACRRNLEAAANEAENMENNFYPRTEAV